MLDCIWCELAPTEFHFENYFSNHEWSQTDGRFGHSDEITVFFIQEIKSFQYQLLEVSKILKYLNDIHQF